LRGALLSGKKPPIVSLGELNGYQEKVNIQAKDRYEEDSEQEGCGQEDRQEESASQEACGKEESSSGHSQKKGRQEGNNASEESG
jgi:hypothetical protein